MPPFDSIDHKVNLLCSQYFWLVERLTDSLGTFSDAPSALDSTFMNLATKLCLGIQGRSILERGSSSDQVDHILVGMMRLLRTLLCNNPTLKELLGPKEENGGMCLVSELHDKCLFAVSTGDFALGAIPLPKCKCPESRAVASDLLRELCDGCAANRSELLDLIITQHLGDDVKVLEK